MFERTWFGVTSPKVSQSVCNSCATPLVIPTAFMTLNIRMRGKQLSPSRFLTLVSNPSPTWSRKAAPFTLTGCGKTTVQLKMLSGFRDFCD
jgi:hypothetical protein